MKYNKKYNKIILIIIPLILLGIFFFPIYFKKDEFNIVTNDFEFNKEVTKIDLTASYITSPINLNSKEINSFIENIHFNKWIGVESWDIKLSPDTFIIINENQILGLLKVDRNNTYINVDYMKNTENTKKTKFNYYKIPVSDYKYIVRLIKQKHTFG